MKTSTQAKIDILIIHRNNLQNAKTYEEYRNAHVAYIDMLIGHLTSEKNFEEVTLKFIYSEFPNKE